MANNDTLSNVLSAINNAEQRGQDKVTTQYNSKVIQKVLDLMKEKMYIGDYEEHDKGLTIHLIGNLNKCNSIKPRFRCSVDDFQKYEQRFLPARDFGVIILTTNKGILTHKQAKEHGVGGKLLSYAY
mgnify:CR=1 FL=1